MNYRLVLVSVFAAVPVLVCAQETKLVNCRTLEAAGNFVGPDEVIDGDMVCQKVKAGDAVAAKPQALKPLPGAVISGTAPASVVDAAKASREIEKQAEAAREAAAGKPATSTEATPEPNAPPAPSTEPSTTAPVPVTPAEPAPALVAPAPPAKKQKIVPQVKVPPTQVAGAPEPRGEPVETTPPASAAVEAAPASAIAAPATALEVVTVPTAASPSGRPATPERALAVPAPTPVENASSAPPEISLEPAAATTAPAQVAAPAKDVTNAATPVSVPAPTVAPAAEPTATTSTPVVTTAIEVTKTAMPVSVSSPAAAPGAETAATSAVSVPALEKGTGFYDANVGNTVVTAAPAPAEPKTGFATPEPANVPAEAVPAAAAEAPTTTAAPMAPPDDPNEERERVVRTGAFEKPQEEGPDPASPAHKTTFLPGDEDGFQEGQRAECTKNVTLGGLKGEKLVLGTPGWAEKWIEKNQKRMPQICFSETPMTGARNYLIVFYTSPGASNAAEATNTSLTAGQVPPASGVGTFTLSYGSTWHYSYDRTVGVTVLTHDDADEPHSQPGQELYATAYTEEGVPVAQHWPEKGKKQVKVDPKSPKKVRAAKEVQEQESGLLLSHLVEDIGKL